VSTFDSDFAYAATDLLAQFGQTVTVTEGDGETTTDVTAIVEEESTEEQPNDPTGGLLLRRVVSVKILASDITLATNMTITVGSTEYSIEGEPAVDETFQIARCVRIGKSEISKPGFRG